MLDTRLIPRFTNYLAREDGVILNAIYAQPRALSVSLCSGKPLVNVVGDDGKKTARNVAQLVCSAWHGDLGGIVDYRDGDAQNCAADNVCWKAGTTAIEETPELLRSLVAIPRLPGYFLTEDGHLFSRIGKQKDGRLRAMFPSPGPERYFQIVLGGNTEKIHVLMCETFHGPRPSPAHVARHLDGDSSHNHKDNLAWGTHSDNKQDSIRHDTAVRGSRSGRARLTEEDIPKIDRMRDVEGKTWKEIGAHFGIGISTVRHAYDRRWWQHVPKPGTK